MRITDTTSIEKLVTSRVKSPAGAMIALDLSDYQSLTDQLGKPSLASDTGECGSIDKLCSIIENDLTEEDRNQAKGVMLFVMTSRKDGMLMKDLQRIDSHFGAPEKGCFRQGMWFDLPEGKNRVISIIWK